MATNTRSATDAPLTPPAPRAPAAPLAPVAPVAPGSRWESVWLALLLAGDLLSTPFHLAAFLYTRRRQRQRLLDELREAAR